MHSPWPQVRARPESTTQQVQAPATPKPRRPRGTRLPSPSGAVYPRVRQYLFDLREPVDVRALATDLGAPVQDVYQALKRLAVVGRARTSGGLWTFIRHAERPPDGQQ